MEHRRRAIASSIAGATLVLVLACSSETPFGPDLDAGIERALASITAAELQAHVRAVAHDSMLGRRTPGPAQEAIGRYLRAALEDAGLRPAVNGRWEQEFEIFFPIAGTGINIVGLLEGSDPQARSEYVVVSAHMDHVGLGPTIAGDSVYNGADDNASGTAALLELAEALSALGVAPRRSVVFAAFSAEEQGLRGSKSYVRDPPLPIETTVANLNLDMVSRNAPDRVAILRSSHTIGGLADAVASRHEHLGLVVIPDPWPEENLLQRSDQWSFIRAGVEGLLMTSGLHEDYHRRSDEAERIDPEKLARVTRLALLILLDLADPTVWNPSVGAPGE